MTLFFLACAAKKQLSPPQMKADDAMQPSAFGFVSNIEHSLVKGSSEATICDFGIFSQGDYPPNDAAFSCLRRKKQLLPPQRKSEDPYDRPILCFLILCVIVKHSTMSLALSFGSRQRLHGSCSYGALVCIRVAPKLCIVMGCFLKKEQFRAILTFQIGEFGIFLSVLPKTY